MTNRSRETWGNRLSARIGGSIDLGALVLHQVVLILCCGRLNWSRGLAFGSIGSAVSVVGKARAAALPLMMWLFPPPLLCHPAAGRPLYYYLKILVRVFLLSASPLQLAL